MIMTQRTRPEAPKDDKYVDDQTAPIDQFDAERAHLKTVLDDVAPEVAAAMKAAGLLTEVLFMDPAKGEALVNFATGIDPIHSDWPQAREIICSIVSSRVGLEGLRCRNVPCAS